MSAVAPDEPVPQRRPARTRRARFGRRVRRSVRAAGRREAADRRFLAALLAIAATASLFLGATGIYGAAAAAVRRREQEFAIRITLGARPVQIVQRVCRESAGIVLIGAAVGVAAALASTRALRAFLYEVSAIDPVTIAATACAVIGLALAATLSPARRATRANPVAVLRG